MSYVVLMIGRKAIRIIERFSHSVLVEYIKTGVQASVSPDCIKRYKPKVKPTKQQKPQKQINTNNQLNLDL
jgi:hypothetical protein